LRYRLIKQAQSTEPKSSGCQLIKRVGAATQDETKLESLKFGDEHHSILEPLKLF